MCGLPRLCSSLFLAAVWLACGSSSNTTNLRYRRQAVQDQLHVETNGLIIGDYTLGEPAVIDGDTIRVRELPKSLRLLALDTEESFKSKKAYRTAHNAAQNAKPGSTKSRPAKYPTPVGMMAKKFAEDFFAGVRIVRLERDDPHDILDRFGRYLAYVMVEKDGVWRNFNIECVRAGMSPYFTKYGYSRRFHQEFVEAQAEAQKAKRGIWDPNLPHYPDYETRLTWWNQRGACIDQFERASRGRDTFLNLNDVNIVAKLDQLVGREVEVLSSVASAKACQQGPCELKLEVKNFYPGLSVQVLEPDTYNAHGLAELEREFVRIRSVLVKGPTRDKRYQLTVHAAHQVMPCAAQAVAQSP